MNEATQQPILHSDPVRQTEIGSDCEILLPDYCPAVLRILQTEATPTIRRKIRRQDHLTLEGTTEYRIVYLPEGEDGLQTVSRQSEFTADFDLKTEEERTFFTEIGETNVTARAVGSRKIAVRSTLNLVLYAEQNELPLTPEYADGTELFRTSHPSATGIASSEKPLHIADEFPTDFSAAAVLCSRVEYRETERKPIEDKLIVKADLRFDLLCADRENRLCPVTQTVPISQILDLPGLQTDSDCIVRFETSNLEFNIPDSGAEHSALIGFDIEILISAAAYAETMYETVCDAYSVRNRTECEIAERSTERYYTVDEVGTVREQTEIGLCGEVLRVDADARLCNLSRRESDGKTVCEGFWICRILFKDGEGIPRGALKEIPFSLETDGIGGKPTRNATELSLFDLTWTRTDATHVEFCGNYRWSGLIFTEETVRTVTAIREGEPLPRKEESLSLVYAREGESVWEIAKDHACSYGDVLQSNGLTEDRLPDDGMIVLFG